MWCHANQDPSVVTVAVFRWCEQPHVKTKDFALSFQHVWLKPPIGHANFLGKYHNLRVLIFSQSRVRSERALCPVTNLVMTHHIWWVIFHEKDSENKGVVGIPCLMQKLVHACMCHQNLKVPFNSDPCLLLMLAMGFVLILWHFTIIPCNHNLESYSACNVSWCVSKMSHIVLELRLGCKLKTDQWVDARSSEQS